MLRTIPIVIVVALYVILTLPVLLFFKLTEKNHADRNRTIATKMIRWLCKVVLFIAGTDLQVSGLENIPEGPVLYMGNHRSIFDIVCGFATTSTNVGFVAKMELKKIPIFRYWMMILGCFFLDRTDIRQGMKTILAAADQIKDGTSVWIYPEGTRTPKPIPDEFKGGSAKIAEKSKCPIVPVSCQGTEEIFDAHQPYIRKATVIFHYCEPIYTDQLSRDEKRRMSEMARQEIIDWRVETQGLDLKALEVKEAEEAGTEKEEGSEN